MIESRCGLICSSCSFKQSHGCRGCVETMGNPFYGECHIAQCCQDNGHSHCGECAVIPCKDLYAYSFLDLEHGDKPQGARIETCRRLAADSGKHKWEGVLLTSSGFATPEGQDNSRIREKFVELLGKPVNHAKVLFIPTAAISEEAKHYVKLCKEELVEAGILAANIMEHDIDGNLTMEEAMDYDVIYITCGNTRHLLERIKQTGFDRIIKAMVFGGKVYVGVSAGSIIATPNIDRQDVMNPDTAGLALVHAYISVHCTDSTNQLTLPLPHLTLTDRQAVWVTYSGFEVIEG